MSAPTAPSGAHTHSFMSISLLLPPLAFAKVLWRKKRQGQNRGLVVRVCVHTVCVNRSWVAICWRPQQHTAGGDLDFSGLLQGAGSLVLQEPGVVSTPGEQRLLEEVGQAPQPRRTADWHLPCHCVPLHPAPLSGSRLHPHPPFWCLRDSFQQITSLLLQSHTHFCLVKVAICVPTCKASYLANSDLI